jgi:hypothetical protein
MSNHLAVATVTATLKRTLDEALAAGTPGSVPNATASTVRPEDVTNGNGGNGVPFDFSQMLPFLQQAYGNGFLGVAFKALDATVAQQNNLTSSPPDVLRRREGTGATTAAGHGSQHAQLARC